jgi:hypothetical protein
MKPDFDAQGEAGLADGLPQVNRLGLKLPCLRRGPP